MRKPAFCICEKTKTQISFAVTAKLISVFVFATRIVQFLIYLNPKCQASSNLLWLYSPVCIEPGRKPRSPVFSQRGSYGFKQDFHDRAHKHLQNELPNMNTMSFTDPSPKSLRFKSSNFLSLCIWGQTNASIKSSMNKNCNN